MTVPPHFTAAVVAKQAVVSTVKSQVATLTATTTRLEEFRAAAAEVPTALASHSSAIAEIIRDNQMMHDALLLLTQSTKSLSVEVAPIRDAALSSTPRTVVDGLIADVSIVQKAIEHLTAVASSLSSVRVLIFAVVLRHSCGYVLVSRPLYRPGGQ
jgi:hypothetical protein